MAHEIETMAYAGEIPWHGLGTKVESSVTVDEMLVASGLNWEVHKKQLMIQNDDGSLQAVKDRFALVRDSDSKIMTITGATWKPLQNKDTLGFMRNYVEAGGATLETAGSLRGGKVIFGLARINHSFDVRPGDTVKGYLLMTARHEVGFCHDVRTTGIRVVCANTLAMAEQSSNLHYRQNHMSEFNVDAAKATVENAVEELAAAERRYKTLADMKLSIDDALKAMIPILLPDLEVPEDIIAWEKKPKTLRDLIASYSVAPGAEYGTGWGAINAATHWADHESGYNGERRTYRALIGDMSDKKLAVEQKLLQLAM